MTLDSKNCPRCGRLRSATAPRGLCPHCLISVLLDPPADDDRAAEQAMPLPAEALERLGHYALQRQVGRGGMGVVFLAHDERLHREVALKLILSGKLASQVEIKRFLAEGEAAARLDHPNIVPIYEIGASEGRHYFVMKWVPGGTLAGRLESGPFENLRSAAVLMAKVARAVHHAHQRGVLHRDIKPGNVLLEMDGEPLIADFGLARRLDDPSGLTLTGTVIGSPSYMAPEQAAGRNDEVTIVTDVYSLGAMLYHLITGRPPFCEASVMETLRAVVEDEPAPADVVNPRVDRDLSTLCMKALAKEPLGRYGSALELAEDLESWLRGEPIRARPVGWVGSVAKWARRHRAMALLLCGLALGTALFVGMLTVSEQRLRRERDFARQQEQLARAHATQALWEASRAETNALQARLNLYSVDIHAAAGFVESGQVGPALDLLKQHIPVGAEADLRGFEWGLLASWCAQDPARVLHGHSHSIKTLAMSADGRWLASGDANEIRLWDLPAASPAVVLPDTLSPRQLDLKVAQGVNVLQTNPALGLRWAFGTGSLENSIHRSRPDRAHATWSLRFSPDATLLVSSGKEEYLKVWNVRDRLMLSWQPMVGADVGWLPEGKLLAVESHTRKTLPVHILQASSGENIGEAGFQAASLVFSGDGLRVCSLELEAGLVSRDTSGLRIQGRVKVGPGRIEKMACSWTGDAVAWITDLDRQGLCLRRFSAPDVVLPTSRLSSRVLCLGYSPDGTQIACGLEDSSVSLLETHTGRELRRLLGHRAQVLSLAWTPTGELVTGSKDQTVRLWQLHTSPRVERIAGRFSGMVVATGKPWIASRAGRGAIEIIQPGVRTNQAVGDSEGWQPIRFQDDDQSLLGMRLEQAGTVSFRRWRMPEGALIDTRSIPWDDVTGVKAYAPSSGDLLVIADQKNASVVSLSSTGSLTRMNEKQVWLEGARGFLVGRRFAARLRAGGVQIWDLDSGRREARLDAPESTSAECLQSTLDGTRIVTGDSDNVIRIWDAASGQLLRSLLGHISPIKALAITSDGRTLASASTDGTCRLWSLATGREFMIVSRGQAFTQLSFLPAGDRLVGLTTAGQFWLWDRKSGL